MTDNEFLLQDRLQKIKQIIGKYGENNFYVSFSGGKDSTVLSALLDMAVPGNKIPRVFANTGIEYRLILDFVKRVKEKDHLWELVILKPTVPIKSMLEKDGYPFKSKQHSEVCRRYRQNPDSEWVKKYVSGYYKWSTNKCPKVLQYQFDKDFNGLKISDVCCKKMKEKPLETWAKNNKKSYSILGLMKEEGGRRQSAKCLAFKGDKLWHFQPLVAITLAWENWFIDAYNIDICEIYKPPYNFERTGCKGCPFALNLQKELDTLEKFFPVERKQCEAIWRPVYDEYRRLGYRLKKKE